MISFLIFWKNIITDLKTDIIIKFYPLIQLLHICLRTYAYRENILHGKS